MIKDYLLKRNRIKEEDTRTLFKDKMEFYFKELFLASVKNKFHRARYFQMLGIYQGDWLNDFDSSTKSFIHAKTQYENFSFAYARDKIKSIQYNIFINYSNSNQLEKSIEYFKSDLVRHKEKVLLMHNYKFIFEGYEKLRQVDSALFYLKQMHQIKDEINQKKNAIEVEKIDNKYNLEEKENELKELSSEKSRLQSKLYTLIPFLGLVILILAVIFYLYRRYRKKSSVLEEEKSQTLQKLDELKQIVVKNHIVLKDKTKLYIADLMYVKADDHYLNLFLSNGKNHFVRGKLKNIKEELPPNFIQCHRSYVVNVNFIKQKNSTSITMINQDNIPLSRSFKDKF